MRTIRLSALHQIMIMVGSQVIQLGQGEESNAGETGQWLHVCGGGECYISERL